MKANELLKRIESESAPGIIDVRFKREFNRGHLPGAINTFFLMPKTGKLPKEQLSELVIYCEHGQRAWLARKILALTGYRNTSLLEGHAKAWRKAGLSLVKTN